VVWANAGIGTFGPIAMIDPEAFARTVEVNLLGAFRTVRTALSHVQARRGYVGRVLPRSRGASAPATSCARADLTLLAPKAL
jgi:NAD(P)-dependent dehydrogenase (short-subunit alcohol dehydrogenase family)